MLKVIFFVFGLCLLANGTTLQLNSTRAQRPEAIIVDYIGMTQSEAYAAQEQLVQYLDMNVNDKQLTSYMWDYFDREDPKSLYLITISKCFDSCFEGTTPLKYIIMDIDRGTNRFMMTGRQKC